MTNSILTELSDAQMEVATGGGFPNVFNKINVITKMNFAFVIISNSVIKAPLTIIVNQAL